MIALKHLAMNTPLETIYIPYLLYLFNTLDNICKERQEIK